MSSLTRSRGNHTCEPDHTHGRHSITLRGRLTLTLLVLSLVSIVAPAAASAQTFGSQTPDAGVPLTGTQPPGDRDSGTQTSDGPQESRLEDWLAQLHAPGEPLISVALSTTPGLASDFDHPRISVTAPQGLLLIDPASGAVLLETAPGDRVQFAAREGQVTVTLAESGAEEPSRSLEPSPPPTGFSHASVLAMAREVGEPVAVLELTRPGSPASARYRGALLVAPAADQPDQLWLVNQVGLEAYLRGVVPVEMPVSFSLEALKAQAVVSRTYALYQMDNGRTFLNGLARLCDGPSCQAYYGAGVERPLSDRAVAETAGIVLMYAGTLIPTYYSSTAGGHTESAALLWGTGRDGAAVAADQIPYLRGVPDSPDWTDLDDEERFRQFLVERPASFDDGSPYYRWQYSWTREELEEHLRRTLVGLPTRVASFIPGFGSGLSEQADAPSASIPASPPAYLQDILPVRRGVSGRLLALQIVTAEGIWTVQGELNIRRLFPVPKLGLLPSAAAVVDLERDPAGVISKVTLMGTGSGHGVGLSQYGADGMARRGYQFTDIVAHYFPGTQTQSWFGSERQQELEF